ncbi:MAG: nucleotidyltransferase family protein [Actinomycetota bacterium]
MARGDIDTLLLDLARPGGTEAPDAFAAAWHGAEPAAVREAVARHRLNASARDALRQAEAEVDPDLDLLLEDDRRVRLLATRALRSAGAALDDAGIAWVVFKGPAISRLMARAELRTSNDLDLLVESSSFGAAVDVLIEAGVDEVNRNWTPYLRHRIGEVPMSMFGVTVDLHWHITGLGRDRSMFRLDPDAMVARRVERPLGDLTIRVFDPIDQLLHLALHAALGGAKRLDQFRDVAVVVSGEVIDWDAFVDRARAGWVDGLVGHLLDRATRSGPADVPDEVVRALAGDGSIDRRRRLDGERVDGLRSLPVLWRRRRRGDVARVLGRRTLDWASGPLHRGWDFTEPRSHLYFDRPSGGSAGRQAYLDAVSSGRL